MGLIAVVSFVTVIVTRSCSVNWIDILDLLSQALLAILVFLRTRKKDI